MSNLPAGAQQDPNALWNNEEENECSYCGILCNDTYCSRDCYIAEIND